MSDLRHFAKLDLGYFENPKVCDLLEERPRIPILHLRAILYCRLHLTDGTFPIRAVMRLAYGSHCGSQCDGQCDFCAAVHAGLFERVDDRRARVHDYLRHQDSPQQVEARKTAGQKAAAARWGKEGDAIGNADRNANRNADGNAIGNAEKRREEKRESVRPDVLDLCELLASKIEDNGSKKPKITKAWTDAARLLLDADKRPKDEATHLIEWCQADDFWRGNILSMATFRKQYDKLRLQADRPTLRAVPREDPVAVARARGIPEGWL